MKAIKCLHILIGVLVTCSVSAQVAGDSVVFYSDSTVDSLLHSAGSPGVSRLLGQSKDKERYLVIIRTKPGNVEIHEQFDDVAIIRSGHGTLKTGRTVKGPQKESGSGSSREWTGGVIQDETERSLLPGDFVVIPAMLAHQYIPRTGEALTYWTIKVRRR